jgi:hypothetical protein
MALKNYLALMITLAVIVLTAALYLALPTLTGNIAKEANADEIKVGTFAVCGEKEGQTFCKDRIFASCNHEPLEVNGTIFYCNGKQYNTSNLQLGETYQLENWTDPRQKDFITAWASSE